MKLVIYITPKIYKRGPNIKIISGKHTHVFENFKDTKIFCTIEDAPSKFTIMHYGKSDKDVVYASGKIIHDVGFALNSIELNDHVLTHEIFEFYTHFSDGTKIQANNYFGHNCYMTFDINEQLDYWIFKQKNKKSSMPKNDNDIEEFIKEILS